MESVHGFPFLSFMVILNFMMIVSLGLGNLCPRCGAAAAEEAVEKARGLTGEVERLKHLVEYGKEEKGKECVLYTQKYSVF